VVPASFLIQSRVDDGGVHRGSIVTKHPGSFEAERAVPAVEAAPAAPELTPASLAQDAQANAAAPAKARSGIRRLLMVGVGLAAIGAAGWYGYDYWTVGRFHVSTDDAYVQADNVTIAPKVSGYLVDVGVQDNETVKGGQVLARIDDRDYKVALDEAKANVLAAQALIDSQQGAVETQNALIDTAKGSVAVDQANEVFAEQENERYSHLATTGYGSVQNAQNASAKIASSHASIERDTGTLQSMKKQLDVIKAQTAQARAALAHEEAAEHQAELNLSYTTITAPVDGTVGNRTLRVGQFVQAGTQLMSVVPSDAAYVVANYKETQLTDVKRGQPATIEVDMFPGRIFHGYVDSMAPASGQTFSLLPPDNATGNFTKVVQRIPVKIILDAESERSGDLRPGMSVEPSIDTTAASRSSVARAE
jgi:membrane fusion protein, multidrug efflux system